MLVNKAKKTIPQPIPKKINYLIIYFFKTLKNGPCSTVNLKKQYRNLFFFIPKPVQPEQIDPN